jgi:hypothetical protein
MRDYFEQQITSRRNRLAALERERAVLAAEIAAYQDALAKTAEGSIGLIETSSTSKEEILPVSKAWRTILTRMAGFTHFNAREVLLAATVLNNEGKLNKPQTREGVRAQLSLYTKKGFLQRLGGGNYRLAEKTRVTLGLSVKTDLGQSP